MQYPAHSRRVALIFVLFLLVGLSSCFKGPPDSSNTDTSGKPLHTVINFFENPLILILPSGVDPPPPNLAGTPPYYPFLVRQSNCSLTQVVIDVTDTVQVQNANYQDTLHQSLEIPTTADKFANGCQDPTTGIASQDGAVVGKLPNANVVVAAISSDGALVSVIAGSGSIVSQQDYPTGSLRVYGLATADLNGDGIPDLVVAGSQNANIGALTVLLGNGDGTFRTGQSLSVSLSSATPPRVGVTIDDVNGDGKLDLIAVTAGTSTTSGITVFLGKGNGTFPTTGLNGPNGVGGVVAVTADFNGDGKKDIATSFGQVLLSKGDGTFQVGAAISQEGQQRGIAASDFNQDGKIDLVFTNSTAATVDLYSGNGDGTFTYSGSYPTIDGATSVETSDLDGDGFPDLFVGTAHGGVYTASEFSGSLFQSLLNYGNGTFGPSQAYFPDTPSQQFDLNPTGAYLQYITASFTSSGKPDLLMPANGASGAAFSVLKGKGDGTFKQPPIQTQLSNPSAPQFISAIVSGDMNGDGKPDMVFAWNDFTGLNPHISVAPGNGDGTFQAQQDYVVPAAVLGGVLGTAHGLVLADLRGTGKPDLAFLTGLGAGTALYVMLNNGDGTLSAPTLIDSRPWMNYLAAQSLRDNGKADIAVAQRCNSVNNVTGNTFLYLGKGDGTFQSATQFNPGFACPNVVAVADMNGDGKPDLVFAGGDKDINATSGFLAVFLGNGDGTFQNVKTATVPAFTGSLPTGIAVADFVAGSNMPGVVLGEAGRLGDIFFVPGNGDGTFNTANELHAFLGINSKELQVTDLTGQGLPDLLLTSGGAEANGAQLSVQVFVAGKPLAQSTTPTTTILKGSVSSVTVGQSVMFTATVTSQSGIGTPTGTVNFVDRTVTIGSGTLNDSAVATFSTSSLAVGTHSITATYQGDSNFAASTSSAVSVQVNSAPTPDFSVSASPTSQTVSPGQGTSYTLTLTPSNGFNQAVTVACTGAPTNATCTPASGSIALNGTASQDQINVMTSAGTMAYRLTPTRGRWLLATTLAILPMLGVLALERLRRSSFKQRYALTFLASSILFALSIGGCGGGNSTAKTATGGTPAGTYTLTLTGTSGSTTHTTTVSLIVQ